MKKYTTGLICSLLLINTLLPLGAVQAEEATQSTETGIQPVLDSSIQELPTQQQQSEQVAETTEEQNTVDSSQTADSETTQESTAGATEETTEESVEDLQQVFGADYYEPAPASRSDLNPSNSPLRSARAAIDVVNAGDATRPRANFIDVSSHNGTITVAQYRMMKTYGVTGVVVKLTEGTTYFNPYAESQIQNARTAGMKVSVYHYSHYTTAAGAQAEAGYFVSKAKALNLPSSTVMVNDIEESGMRVSAFNANTTAFKNAVNASGYSKVVHYLSRSWLDVAGGPFSTATFGKSNVWVAQYPYSPAASMNWNNDFSAWQWSSNYYFPGIAHPFDINTDYTGTFSADSWDGTVPTGVTTVNDTKKTETTFTAKTTISAGKNVPVAVTFAVWSEAGGQDDLKWYNGVYNTDGTWSANINVANHKSTGKYLVHTYAQMSNFGNANYNIGSGTFSVQAPSVTAKTQNYNQSAGTFDVIVTGQSVSGISQVKIPVWSQANQSDLKWYEATKQSDGSYKATVDIKNHNYNSGVYNVHAYLYAINGVAASVASAPIKVTAPTFSGKVAVSDTSKNESAYTATVTLNMGSYGTPKAVQLAVWSKNNGQDDLRWYNATRQSNGKYSAKIPISNHKDSGDYFVHTYAQLSNGSSKFVADTTFTVTPPTLTVSTGAYNASAGTFTVVVKGSSKSGISSVKIPVWSKNNQSDLKWYDGVKQSDGSYKITVNIKNHSYNTGKYNVHAYQYSANGVVTAVAGKAVTVTAPVISGKVTAADTSKNETTYTLTSTVNMGLYGTPKAIRFAVWSSNNGQDDIRWYTAAKQSNGSYTAKVPVSNHKDSGKYFVHTYATLPDGSNGFVADTTFTVTKPTVTATTGAYNSGSGTFDVIIKGSSISGIDKVRVPVWSKANQSDIKWYDAVKQSNGTYKVTVNKKNHSNNTGKYTVHAYVYSKNGVTASVAAQPVTVK